MNKSITRKLLAACTFGCMAAIAMAAEAPVQLHIDAAKSTGGLALLSESGWPLTIRMVVDFPQGTQFPAYATQPNFAVRGHWGFIIFDDPDGCLNPPAPSWMVAQTVECGVPDPRPEDWNPWTDWVKPPSDETYMEFWPDVDMAGVVDNTGNADRQTDLLDSEGSRGPEFQKWNAGDCEPGNNDANCERFGPNTGGETTDGFGFGADDDVTGLVIIAEYGVGRVFLEPEFELSDPVGAVNLAGLVNSVSYDLSVLKESYTKPEDAKGKPTLPVVTEQARIWAHMNMENGVVRHLIQYDACTGDIDLSQPVDDDVAVCLGNDLWRVDGGPQEVPPKPFEKLFHWGDAASKYLLESTIFTLKVFLVAGQAPNRLFDEDLDGDVDSADAVAAGYTLLSNEASVRLLQASQELCFGGGSGWYKWDLDDNTVLRQGIVCPGGPGDLSRPPR